MSKEEAIGATATVLEAPRERGVQGRDGRDKHEVLAHISGRMRKNFIRILPGD